MNFFKKTSPKVIAFLIIVYLSLTLIGCPPKSAKKILEETTPKETVEESKEEVEEIVVEETPEEEKYLSKEEFLEKIKEYDIIYQAFVYSKINYEIALDWSEGKITKEEASIKYLQLATQIGEDFFLVDLILGANAENITAEQKNIIGLIQEWSTKMEYFYKYYSNYLDTGQAEYEIKVDELEDEAEKIKDEYIKAIKEYMEK